jgi:hypothetical protein
MGKPLAQEEVAEAAEKLADEARELHPSAVVSALVKCDSDDQARFGVVRVQRRGAAVE